MGTDSNKGDNVSLDHFCPLIKQEIWAMTMMATKCPPISSLDKQKQ